MNLLQAKHGFVIGVGGSGKTFFIRNLIKEDEQKCIYISTHSEDFGDSLCISMRDPSSVAKEAGLAQLSHYLKQDKSFVIQIESRYIGDGLTNEYLNDVLIEILKCNKDFTLIIDAERRVASDNLKDTYIKLLTQKVFPVVSALSSIYEDLEYIFDYAEVIYLFKLYPRDFEYFEKRGLLSMSDTSVVDQKVGEYKVISR